MLMILFDIIKLGTDNHKNNNMNSADDNIRQREVTYTAVANDTSEPVPAVCLSFEDIAIAFLVILLVLFATVGNFAVVAAVLAYRRMRSFTNMLLVSLATADFFVGLLIMPPAMVYLIRSDWPFGALACRLWATTDVLLCTASILNLCVISIDRYIAILYPLQYLQRRTKQFAVALILSVWVLSVVVCAPPWFIPSWKFSMDAKSCGYVDNMAYRIYSALGSFYLPLIVMLFVYYKILRVTSARERQFRATASAYPEAEVSMHDGGGGSFRSQRDRTMSTRAVHLRSNRSTHRAHGSGTIEAAPLAQQNSSSKRSGNSEMLQPQDNAGTTESPNSPCVRAGSTSNKGPAVTFAERPSYSPAARGSIHDMTISEAPSMDDCTITNININSQSKGGRNKREKTLYLRERKALKTIGIIVVGFIICWLPFFITYIIESACSKCYISEIMNSVFLWLGYSNSVLNPLIYTLYNQDFRRCFREIVTCGCLRNRANRRMSVRLLHAKN